MADVRDLAGLDWRYLSEQDQEWVFEVAAEEAKIVAHRDRLDAVEAALFLVAGGWVPDELGRSAWPAFLRYVQAALERA